MTVYVDEFRVWAPTRIRCFRNGSCHMTADTLEELHAMAKQLRLKREWFQAGSTPHYDLTLEKRSIALGSGAVFVPAREQARKRIMARSSIEPPWHGPEDGDLWTAGEDE